MVYIRKGLACEDVTRRRIARMSEVVREEERVGKMKRIGWLSKAKPYLLMLGLQFGMAGNYIFGKDILDRGMSRFVFIVYRNSMASFFLAPFAFFLERSLPIHLPPSPYFHVELTYLASLSHACIFNTTSCVFMQEK